MSIKKSTGKGSFTIVSRDSGPIVDPLADAFSVTFLQRLDRLPPQLLTSSGKLSLALLLGSFDSSSPLHYPLTTLRLPSAILRSKDELPSPRDVQAKEQGYLGWEERRHTFATPASETMPPKFLSLSIAVATVSFPWVVLLALVSKNLAIPFSSLY